MDEQTGFDPRKRRLCPDGTCTGVIGADGRCGECGRVAGPGGGGSNGVDPAAADTLDDQDLREAMVGVAAAAAAAPESTSGDGSKFDPNRRLCADGSCVGVIGPNGACAVCGRVAG